MKLARFTAFGVILLTALWIGSGYLRSSTPTPPPARMAEAERPPFRVLVESVKLEQHARRLASPAARRVINACLSARAPMAS